MEDFTQMTIEALEEIVAETEELYQERNNETELIAALPELLAEAQRRGIVIPEPKTEQRAKIDITQLSSDELDSFISRVDAVRDRLEFDEWQLQRRALAQAELVQRKSL